LFEQNQVKKTYNFVNGKQDVYGYSSHGTNVLSCVGGKHEDVNLGLARDAEFLLARTEKIITELFGEEENWLKAAEWADKHGADIINSSLGYLYHRYFPKDMDGKTSLVAEAARKASKKGILVVNSAGNAGSSDWKYIGTPADVEQVLTVGGTNPKTDAHIGFSAFGPAADHTMKPNVCALGKVVAAKGSDYSIVRGTSFSSPLVAGFAACAWQANRNLSTSQMFEKIEASSHLYPYFDYAHGYGIPQADHFLEGNPKKDNTTFSIESDKDSVYVKLTDEAWDQALEANNKNLPIKKNLFYHIEAANGTLRSFKVVRLEDPKLSWSKEEFYKNEVLRVHFEGYTSKQIIR
jgi:subtilisin family serine protease